MLFLNKKNEQRNGTIFFTSHVSIKPRAMAMFFFREIPGMSLAGEEFYVGSD
jgi:hypothetical protein